MCASLRSPTALSRLCHLILFLELMNPLELIKLFSCCVDQMSALQRSCSVGASHRWNAMHSRLRERT